MVWNTAFPGRRTYVFSVDNFSGKAREHVFCFYLSTSPFTLSTTTTTLIYPQPPNQPTAHSTSATRPALLFSHSTTRHHSIALRRSDFTRDATLCASNINTPQHDKKPSGATFGAFSGILIFWDHEPIILKPFRVSSAPAMEQRPAEQQSAQQRFARAIKKAP